MVYKYFNIVFNKMNRKYLINFIILMVTILLFLLVFEFSLRIFSPQPVLIRSHIEASPTIFQEEEDIPWGLKPLVNTRHIGIFDEWNVSIKTNNFGLRDDDYTYDQNVKKILFLGDSFTFGYGVEKDEIYVEILEDLLGKNYTFLNAGYASGYSPDTAYVYLKEKGLDFNPKFVVLGFFIGNDIDDVGSNEWVKIDDDGLPNKIISNQFYIDNKNRLRVKGDENVIQNNPFQFFYKINIFLSYKSHLYVFLKDRLKPLFYELLGQPISMENSIYANVYTNDTESFLVKTEKAILGIKKLLKDNGGEFIIILIPSRDQFSKERDYTYNFTKPNEVLLNFGKENDLIVLDLLPHFKNEDNPLEFYYEKDPHWNSRGHEFAARKIYEELNELNVI